MTAFATLILRNGRVATPTDPSGFAQAIAIDGNSILALGSDVQIDEYRNSQTRVIDLKGRLASPAFGDAHVHASSGGLESLRCNLLGLRDRYEYLAKIAEWSKQLGPNDWVLGGGWAMEGFPGGVPSAEELDSVTGGRPAFLPNRDHHSAWVNTRALEMAGIDNFTSDPFDGRIERDPTGKAVGALHDGAMGLVAKIMPPTSREELADGLRAALQRLHSEGITHWQDACIGYAGELGINDTYEAYIQAEAEGWLTARVRGALWWDRSAGLGQLSHLQSRREQAGGGLFRATSIKMMMDGVCETFTAAMSRAYVGAPGANGTHKGSLFVDGDELKEIVRTLDDQDFQVHFHTLGDFAISTALDAIESLPEVRRQVGRHHMAHLQFVNPKDVKRFGQLGVVANFQPLWAMHDPQMDDLTLPFVDDDMANWQYSINTLQTNGARVAFGSDWPVSSPNPIYEMHAAVNRTAAPKYGRPGERECTVPFRPEEALSIDEALRAFTQGVAYVNRDENVLGTLETGKQADVVVLNQDLYSIPSSSIGDTSVDLTISSGAVVFGDE